jgi:hypothetical protein
VKFAMMGDNEGPTTLMQLIYCRDDLERAAVKTQAYDNFRNAVHHALNREPAFFRNADGYVDNFHWQGHVACSVSLSTGAPAASSQPCQQ